MEHIKLHRINCFKQHCALNHYLNPLKNDLAVMAMKSE